MNLSNFIHEMWAHVPGFASLALLVIATLLAGVLLAVGLRLAVRWGVRRFGLETLAERLGISKLLYTVGIQRGVAFVSGEVVFYTVLVLTLHSTAQYLGLPGLSELLAQVVGFLPTLLAALLILAAGIIGADVLAKLVQRFAKHHDAIESPTLLGRMIYYAVIILAAAMAAEQIGLETTLINNLIAIVTAASFFGVALAFALGARVTFQNLIARYYITQAYRVGDHIHVAEVTGTIVAFSPVGVVLQSGSEEIIVPCKAFFEQAVHLRRVATPSSDIESDMEHHEPQEADEGS